MPLDIATHRWAAGLQLAGLALRDRADSSAFVAAFAGSHRLVADYLTAEVIDQQPVALQRFLLTTGVLDRLCAPLCDALLAEACDGTEVSISNSESQTILEELERSNLFLIPLDDTRRWYRYHHLFGDFLRQRQLREIGLEGVHELYHHASGWFERNGLLNRRL